MKSNRSFIKSLLLSTVLAVATMGGIASAHSGYHSTPTVKTDHAAALFMVNPQKVTSHKKADYKVTKLKVDKPQERTANFIHSSDDDNGLALAASSLEFQLAMHSSNMYLKSTKVDYKTRHWRFNL